MFPLTMAGLSSAANPGATAMGPAAGGAAAMGPVGWAMLGLSALSMLGGMGKKQNTTKFLDPINVGEKPVMNAVNPYQSPMASTGQDPYGRMMNPTMRKQPTFSSALGRYGGLR